MSSQSRMITVPRMELDLDQFLAVVRQLDKPARVQVARVLAETEIDADLRELIEQLARATPMDEISDAEIETEIEAVRREGR